MGKRLAHYEIIDRLGEGGMGVVYRAEDVNLRRPVALKVLPDALTQHPVARERLIREARAASRLGHQNIATIYEVGEHEGQLFLAMEFVDGQSLLHMLRQGPLAEQQVIQIGARVADALQAAHSQGVIHRDVKPGNILVKSDGTVKVVDFGLAMRTEPVTPDSQGLTSTEADRLTRTGQTTGTVSYMSPEQARDGITDRRSEIFSLGVVLYEAATGRKPFTGQNPLATAAAIIHDDPVPPREINPTMSPRLEQIILRCLSKDRNARPQTAGVVRDVLTMLTEDESSASIRRVLGRRPRVRAAAGVLGLLVVAGAVAGAITLMRSWTGNGPPIEDEEARRLYQEGIRLEQRGYSRSTLELAERQYRGALGRAPDNPWIQAQLARVLASLQLQYPVAGRPEEIRELADRALARRPRLAPAWYARGRLLLLEGKPEPAEAAASKVKRYAPEHHDGYVLMGLALVKQGRADDGIAELRRGIGTTGGHVWARMTLARVFHDLGRLDEAAAEYTEILRYQPDSANALNNLGAIYLATGRLMECIPLFRKLLELQPDGHAASNLGTAYFYLDRMPEAIGAYKRAVELAPDFPSHKRNLGEAYEKLGRPQSARQWYEGAIADCDGAFAAGNHRAEFVIDWAFCSAKLGRFEQAARKLDQALEDRQNDMYLLYCAAQVQAMAGQQGRAYELVRRAVQAGYPREEFRRDASFQAYQDDLEFQAILTTPQR